tara:strand:- start:36651 stop:37721 length:1071 start_codon:yes stop_codon:yes gene_type:complete
MDHTIDKLHNDYINNCSKQNTNINKKKKQLSKLINNYNNIKNNNAIEIEIKLDYLQKIDNLKKEIELTINNYYEIEYFDKSIDILLDYYSLQDKKQDNKIIDIDKMFDTNIVDNSKSILHNKYIKNVYNINTKYESSKIRTCVNPDCNKNELTLHSSNGYFSCIKCGYCEEMIIEGDKTAYKQSSNENSIYAYKRINHFNEWLSQFQGKESTDIPEDLYEKISIELKKSRINTIEQITIDKMRKILKNLGYNKYYEHIPHILTKIGKKAPKISKKNEEKLRAMFKQIQEPFNIYCPKDRKNFLSYSYTLHKFCELLELDDIAVLFPMLKSREKLKEQDVLWKNICNHLHWEFIPSI